MVTGFWLYRHYAVSLEAGNGCQGYEMNTNFSLFQCNITLTVSIDFLGYNNHVFAIMLTCTG